MIVQFCLGLYKWDVGEREAAAASYREILRKGQNATWRDRMLKIVNSDSISGIPNEISGTVIDEIMETTRDNLAQLEGTSHAIPQSESASSKLLGVLIGPNGTKVDAEEVAERRNVGGNECDQCGIKKSEDVKLKTCGRCKMVYYCSKDCARAAWKSIHKKACRAPGQVEPGDYVIIHGFPMMPLVNGEVVVAKARRRLMDVDVWSITIIGTEAGREIPIPATNVRRIRPKTNHAMF